MDNVQKNDTTLSKGQGSFSGGNDLPKKNLNENVPYVPVAKKTTDDKINIPNLI
jgi:hypothetical protein